MTVVAIETDPTLSPAEAAPSPVGPVSDDSRAWFGSVRAGVKARLFSDANAGSDAARARANTPPTRIGRYVVIKRIGAGGMGVVYAAYDDQLDRKVAVKLLRPGFGPGNETARQRLLREAQAIAKLSHRAVIGVYEVGTHLDEVFIAMEYVEGSTLKQWQPSRDWHDVLGRYLEAGRGLCAAHDAGIVHRDFKADNVLVRASDLSVRVVDFGLARTGQPDPGDASPPPEDDVEAEPSLTHTGLVMGTPAYMSPEQHLALPADPRTDQFAFCASLFEALYGFRAFAGERLDELRANVLAGRVEPAPRYTAVPANIHAALTRGLSVDPQTRHPTMEALLAQLELPRPARPWRRISLALGVTAVVVAGSVAIAADGADDLSAQAMRMRASYDSVKRRDAAAELARLKRRSMPERWNDLVLAYAGSAGGPTDRLAALAHLSVADAGALEQARSIADEALRGGPIFATLPTASPVAALAFAPDAPRIVARTEGGEILYWSSPRDPTPERVAHAAIAAAAGPQGRIFVALGNGELATIDPDGSQSVRNVHDAELTCVAADSSGRVAVGAADGTIVLLDGTNLEVLDEHDAAVGALAFHPAGHTLASGDRSGKVSLWFLDRETHRAMGIDDEIRDLAWMRDAEVVVAQTSGGTMAWDGQLGTRAAAPVPRDAIRFGASTRSSVVVWRTARDASVTLDDGTVMRLDGSEEPAALAVSSQGRWSAAAGPGGVTLWRSGADLDGVGPRGDRRLNLDAGDPLVGVHAFGDRIVVVTSGGDVLAQGTDGFEPIAALAVEVRGVLGSPDGASLAIASSAGSLHVVRMVSGVASVALAPDPAPQPGPMAWSRDGRVVAKLHCASPKRCDASLHPIDGEAASWVEGIRRPIAMRPSPKGDQLALLNDDQVTTSSASGRRHLAAAPAGKSAIAIDFSSGGVLRMAWVGRGDTGVSLHVAEHDADGDVLTVFEEDGLRRVVATTDRDAVVLETSEGRLLLWRLREDRFHPLADGALPQVESDLFHVSERGLRLWVEREDSGTMTVLDDLGGRTHTLPRLVGPHATLESGGWVEIAGPRTLRIWGTAAPARGPAFVEWLRTRTMIALPISALRRSASPSDEAL